MLKAITMIVALFLLTPTAEAASYNCGRYMSKVFGLKKPIALALAWAKFPRTSARPGAVVVQTRKGRALGGGPGGHVSKIISLVGPCRAIVNDNRGTYERDICTRLVAYVIPEGAQPQFSSAAQFLPHETTWQSDAIVH